MLISRSLPASSGFASVMLNQGSLKNKGVEISLNGDILRNLNGWSWSLGGNIGFNKSKIGDLGFAPTDFGTLKNVRGYQGTSIGDHLVLLIFSLQVRHRDCSSDIRLKVLFSRKIL